ncbi:hypothetical protein ABI59_01880 [Acidobacteria bacterium Mor1]|nr:hypothetical protein ABI59_01880 [Acidobacteria bacterium Mor1]
MSILRALAVLLVALAGPSILAETGDRELRGLQSWLDGTERLEARFEQELQSGALGTGLTESGSLILARPGRMRWDYLDPEFKVALFEGNRMELYLEEEAQLIRTPIPEDGDLLPSLLAGRGRLADLFRCEGVERAGDSVVLKLIPRRESETLEELTVSVRRRDSSIQAVEVRDAAGNLTAYRFLDLRRNGTLPDDAFAFTPPPGTEILE